MLKKSLLDRMKESKNKNGVAYISRFNDGKVRVDENYMTPMIKYANDSDAFDPIGEVLYNNNEQYARDLPDDFDTLSMDLSLGLMFDGKYVDANQHIREDAVPVEGVVRYYTGRADCISGDKVVNDRDKGYVSSRQGFINYGRLVSSAEKNGLVFNGPRTFEEFKEMILMGEPFDITLVAGLGKKVVPTTDQKQFQK